MPPKLYKAADVCELAQVQPYVLRSWESEFPDLGVSKSAGGPRIYRRPDVERVLRIKQLVFSEGEFGRDGGIRTHDPLTPSQVRYQAALHPDQEVILR